MDENEVEPLSLNSEAAHRAPVSADELRKRLEELHDQQEKGFDPFDESCSEDEDEKKAKRKAFAARRKAHYNEFLVMKQLR